MKLSRVEFREPVPIPGNGRESSTYPKVGMLSFQNGLVTWAVDGHTPTLIPIGNVKFMIPSEEKK